MKRLMIFWVLGIFIMGFLGCAASTLSRTVKDGATTLSLKNYVYTEIIYCADGKTICSQNTMVPADSIVQGMVDKIVTALKSLVGTSIDTVKTVLPEVVPRK